MVIASWQNKDSTAFWGISLNKKEDLKNASEGITK